jgi:Zn-dependent protease with chaperone function
MASAKPHVPYSCRDIRDLEIVKWVMALMLLGLAVSAQAQVLLTGRAQTFQYTNAAVQAVADVAAAQEYLEFSKNHALASNTPMQTALDELLQSIVAQAKVLRPRLGALNWRVLLVRDANYTMTAKPNGLITISEPYLRRRAFTNEELAFLLAHEVAHVAAEHVREELSAVPRHFRPGVSISALQAAQLPILRPSVFEDMAPMRRSQEREADLIGALLVRPLGISGPQILTAFDRMARAEIGYQMSDDYDPALVRKQELAQALARFNNEIKQASAQ